MDFIRGLKLAAIKMGFIRGSPLPRRQKPPLSLIKKRSSRGNWFDVIYKRMEENLLYKLYVVGGVGGFLFLTNKVERHEHKMVVDELVSLNEWRITSEEQKMEQGDKLKATEKDSKAVPVVQNPLSQAILRLMCGRSGRK